MLKQRIIKWIIVGLLILWHGTIMAIIPYKQNGNTLYFGNEGKESMRIEFCNPQMIRITKSPDGNYRQNENWMVVKYDFDNVNYEVIQNSTNTIVRTEYMELCITTSPWLVSAKNLKGKVLYKETAITLPSGKQGPSTTCLLGADEHFFGFGERMDFLDQRGQKLHLNVELGRGPRPAVGGKDILRANYCPVPFFMSTRGYALFFHNASPTDWDMGWSDIKQYKFSADCGELDYYLIVSSNMEGMLRNYQLLTGNAPLMPRSAYGLHVGSYSGGTWNHETEASDSYNIEVVRRLRKEQIPFDMFWLDSTWRIFGKRYHNGGCSFEFQHNLKNPSSMIDSIYANNVNMFGLHIRSIVDDGYEGNTLFQDAVKAKAVYPGASTEGIINFFNQKSVDWWWDNAMKRIVDLGVQFVKTDVGSAFHLKDDMATLPGTEITGKELHNLFPIVYAKAPFLKFQTHNKKRGLDHTREGYAGIQRYPFIWAGDWGTEWQWFEPVIRGGLNIGLSGIGNWAHCMGGFEQYSDYDTDLYLRWVQFGMFSPVAMLFGMDHPRYHMPWTYGEEAMNIFRQYDNLRYSLIPYIYTSAYQMYTTSRPIMAPLVYDNLNDERTYQISDQYMFGPGMMICPVVTKNALSRYVYFPKGKWIDFWTGERLKGRQYKSFLTPIERMPIFIKEGAIIPRQKVVQFIGEKPINNIELLIFPTTHSSYFYYEDDGESLDYQSGEYSLTEIDSRVVNNTWTLKIQKPIGNFKPTPHTYSIQGYWDQKPTVVIQNGKTMPERNQLDNPENKENWWYDNERHIIYIQSQVTNMSEICLSIK